MSNPSDLRAQYESETAPRRKAELGVRYADALEKYYQGEAELFTSLGALQRQLKDIEQTRRDLSNRLDEMAEHLRRGKLPRDSRFFDLRYKAADLANKVSDFKFTLERLFQF